MIDAVAKALAMEMTGGDMPARPEMSPGMAGRDVPSAEMPTVMTAAEMPMWRPRKPPKP
jgi:hypothetical protein